MYGSIWGEKDNLIKYGLCEVRFNPREVRFMSHLSDSSLLNILFIFAPSSNFFSQMTIHYKTQINSIQGTDYITTQI